MLLETLNRYYFFVFKMLVLGVAVLAPASAFAQGTGTLQSLIAVVANIVGLLTSIGAALAFVAFFWGIALFVLNVGDEKKAEEGKSWMLWSIIAIFVLVTIWGIIALLQKTVGNTGDGLNNVQVILPQV